MQGESDPVVFRLNGPESFISMKKMRLISISIVYSLKNYVPFSIFLNKLIWVIYLFYKLALLLILNTQFACIVIKNIHYC